MNAYSPDLRTKILQAIDKGMSQSEAARVFAVGRSTIKRYLQLRRHTGDLAPKRHPGRARLIPAAAPPALLVQWATYPDAPLAEHCRLWTERTGQLISRATMCRMYQRLAWTHKKSPSRQPNATTRRARPSRT
jgi:transposase